MKSLQLETSAISTRCRLRQFDPRLRIIATLLFIATCASLQQPIALASALLFSLCVAFAQRIKPALLARRLLFVEGFMLALLLTLPFSVQGQTLLQIGPLTASVEGAGKSLEILLKANAIIIMLLSLLGTLEPVVLGHALARLGVPEKLIHLFLFTVRYIGILQDEYQRLRLAMRARAFSPGNNRHSWRTFGGLIGMLLIRSLERSERILAAMKCRGFNNRLYLMDSGYWRPHDSRVLLLWLLPLSVLLTLELNL